MKRKLSPPFEVFFCYAREDRAFCEELEKHLKELLHFKLITVWDDGNISPGTPWEQEIKHHLSTAQIILLLISPDFLSSDYCYSNEMIYALRRHQAKEAIVIPVFLRPVALATNSFGILQGLPKNGLPITSWPNRDEAFADVAKGIHLVVNGLLPLNFTVPDLLTAPSSFASQAVSSVQRTKQKVKEELPKKGNLRPFLGNDKKWHFIGQETDENVRRIVRRSSRQFWKGFSSCFAIALSGAFPSLIAVTVNNLLYAGKSPYSFFMILFIFIFSIPLLFMLLYKFLHLKDIYILTNKRIISSTMSVISFDLKNRDVSLDAIAHIQVLDENVIVSLVDGTFRLKGVKDPQQVKELLQKLVVIYK